MSKAAQKKPLILVSHEYNPQAWASFGEGESETQSWLAVAQDLWGPGCYGPGQTDGIRQGANGLTVTKQQIVGAIGGALGGVGEVAADYGAYIDVFDCDAAVLAHNQQGLAEAVGGKLLKLFPWTPAKPELKADRYHSLIAAHAFAYAPAIEPLAKVLATAVKGGGQLYVDEFYAADPSVSALIAQGTASPGQQLTIHPQDAVMQALKAAGLELRSSASASEPLMAAIFKGLTRGQEIAQILKTVPQPFRKQRMLAFANELQRTAVLYQALDKGLVTATRSIHYKPRQL
jgi:hypothetical protein